MVAWGMRLSIYLHARDTCADAAPPQLGARVLWSVVISLPCVLCNTRQRDVFESTPVELSGVAISIFCLLGETVADYEKHTWFKHAKKTSRPDRTSTSAPVITNGWWHYSRNPNLFFEIMFHWGIYFIVKPVNSTLVVLTPLFNTFMIMHLPGGIRTREKERNKRFELYPAYLSYRDSTSPCFPMPPQVYDLLRRLGVPELYTETSSVNFPDYSVLDA
jgi:steroid 5-alpha reductase family enzyme